MKAGSELMRAIRTAFFHNGWLDMRHFLVFAGLVFCVIMEKGVNLTKLVFAIEGRAKFAQSRVRRLSRWLENPRISHKDLYGPVIAQAVADWGKSSLFLALDTSMFWDRFCLIRVSIIYRGRAIPLVWKVIEHKSSSVAFTVYEELLKSAADLLSSVDAPIIFLADRGFVHAQLMRHIRQIGWQFRIRIKSNSSVILPSVGRRSVSDIAPPPGRASFLHGVRLGDEDAGLVHLAVGNHTGSGELWAIVSSQPTGIQTFKEYGLRFDIEEEFLDEKSGGFDVEQSGIRSADALERLFLPIAAAILFLVIQGVQVVRTGKRRCVDPHWFRGWSYLKIGWAWVKQSVFQGRQRLWSNMRLVGGADPQPAIASKKQAKNKRNRFHFECNHLIFNE